MHVKKAEEQKFSLQRIKKRMFDKPLGAELIGLTRFSRKYLPIARSRLNFPFKSFKKFIFMIVQEKIDRT
jgi:hypothetical protein